MKFSEFVEEHLPGKREAGVALNKLIDAVRDVGKPGTLTIQIKIEPDKVQPHAILISEAIVLKAPKHERPVRKAWLMPSGAVVDYDPDAPPLDGMAVDKEGRLVSVSPDDASGLEPLTVTELLQHGSGLFSPFAADVVVGGDEDENRDLARPDVSPFGAADTEPDEDGVPELDEEPAELEHDEDVPDIVPAAQVIEPEGIEPPEFDGPAAVLEPDPEPEPVKKARAPRKPRAPRKLADAPQA